VPKFLSITFACLLEAYAWITSLDGRSEISDLRDFPFRRAAEWARITPEKKNPNRRLTQIYSARVYPAPDRSEGGIVIFQIRELGNRSGMVILVQSIVSYLVFAGLPDVASRLARRSLSESKRRAKSEV
jgi:hypothetical protein